MNKKIPLKKNVLSIIIASQNAASSAERCLSEIEHQCTHYETEIIVIDNSTDETAELIRQRFPNLSLIKLPPDKLIPELWQVGINKCRGDLVALTTTHFVPEKSWVSQIINAHKLPFAGIGGAIENDSQAGFVSWAVYFCRYSRYMLPFEKEKINDFAADNASYKHAALEEVQSSMSSGFWEVFVHQAMKEKKMELILLPEIVVYHEDSLTFQEFMRQRFLHGRQFGSARLAHISGTKRMVLIFFAPLIPLLYLYRITRRILRKKRNFGKYFLALPILSLFLISWASGEFCGYLTKSK